MTTNRMGLERTLSDEQLEELITELELCGIYGRQVCALAELQEFRKASKNVYGYVHKSLYEEGYSVGLSGDHEAYRDSSTHIPLYSAPLQAVTVPDAIEPDYDVIKGILPTSNPDEYACCIAADMWNACRALMLKSVTNEP